MKPNKLPRGSLVIYEMKPGSHVTGRSGEIATDDSTHPPSALPGSSRKTACGFPALADSSSGTSTNRPPISALPS